MNHTDFQEKYQKKLLETFKIAVEFLNSRNLLWFAADGTALGAVRHKGIIPWDDDVDIYMLREDYQKLMELREDLKCHTCLDMETLGANDSIHTYIKIVNTETTLIEKENLPISGFWIDVFPLDYYDRGAFSYRNKIKIYKKHFHNYQRSVLPLNIKSFCTPLVRLDFGGFWENIKSRTYYKIKSKEMLNIFRNFEDSMHVDNGANLVCYTEEVSFMKEWFADYLEMPFNDFKVRVPVGYHEYLTYAYGDYMTPPPPEKQVMTHTPYYVNIERRLSKKQVRNSIKTKEYQSNSNVFYGGKKTLKDVLKKS